MHPIVDCAVQLVGAVVLAGTDGSVWVGAPPVVGAPLLGAVVVGVAGVLELVGAGVDGDVRVGEVVRERVGVGVGVEVDLPGDVV